MFTREVSRALDEEHRATLALLGKLELACARGDRLDAGLADALARLMQADVTRHFAFEETALFPRLSEAGDGDVAALLADEHEAIRQVAAELMPLAQAAARGALDTAAAHRFRRTMLELVERQVSHIQKETMALLPMLDDLLDENTDRELAFAYRAT